MLHKLCAFQKLEIHKYVNFWVYCATDCFMWTLRSKIIRQNELESSSKTVSIRKGKCKKKPNASTIEEVVTHGGPPSTEGRPGSGSTASKTKCFPAACLFCACCRSQKSRSYCWEDLPLDVLSLSSQMWAGSVVPGRCLLRKFPSCLAIRSLTVKCMYIV